MKIRDRIKDFRYVLASELRPNPKNWRTHPQHQQDALRGALAEVGMADAVIARELEDGSLMLLDGHLRAEAVGGEVIPVLVLDVTEPEADKILLLFDPLSGMAGTEEQRLDELLRNVQTGSEPLAAMLDDLAADAGLYQAGDENKGDELRDESDERGASSCPRCGGEAEAIT